MALPDCLPLTLPASIEFYTETLERAVQKDERALAMGRRGELSYLNQAKRWLARNDLFFLLVYCLKRKDVASPWLFDRCREVGDSPNGHLDLWAREHYKSTIITFALSIQDILASHGKDPDPRYLGREITIGIFSHTKSIATDFLDMIKQEFETNADLIALFPEILWEKPRTQAPMWSKQDGIVVKRRSNPREATVEAWGLVDGQPTGKHFFILCYDDVVTEASVSTADQIAKTTAMWELSDNLGTEGGWKRYAGTRYALFDTYAEMIERDVVHVRLHSCTLDGSDDFTEANCVLKSPEYLAEKRITQGPYTFGAQMLLDPTADKAQGFKDEWLQYWPGGNTRGMNIYIIVDPASGKKAKQTPGATTGRNAHAKDTGTDYTVMEVIGVGGDRNYYTLDRIRDRLNLTERTTALFELHRLWSPKGVGYETYGLQADIEHIQEKMARDNYRFTITELGGQLKKVDRIRKLIPIYEQKRWFELDNIIRPDWEGKAINLSTAFIREEYLAFPVVKHDDILDAKARILDPAMGVVFPKEGRRPEDKVADWERKLKKRASSWAAG